MEQFSPSVIDEIQFYVYALMDPRNNQIFYIGKGQGNRVFQHAADALESSNNTDRLDLIREILASKDKDGNPLQVKYFIIRHHLDEQSALLVESVLIDLLTYSTFSEHTIGSLTNIQKGMHQNDFGITTTDEICRKYGAQVIDLQQLANDMKLNFITINIKQSFDTNASDNDIYEATRQSWNVSFDKANNSDYALGIYKGCIVGVYYCRGRWVIDSAQSSYDDPGTKRHMFDQPTQLPSAISNQLNNLRQLLRNRCIEVVKGSKNPIKYYEHN